MTWAGLFCPALPPQHLGRPGAPPVLLARSSLRKVCSPLLLPLPAQANSPPQPPKESGASVELPGLDLGPSCSEQDDTAEEAAQFAPLLVLRRKQVIEATEAAVRGSNGTFMTNGAAQGTAEDLLMDALDALMALSEATRSADAFYEEVLGDFDGSRLEAPNSIQREALGPRLAEGVVAEAVPRSATRSVGAALRRAHGVAEDSSEPQAGSPGVQRDLPTIPSSSSSSAPVPLEPPALEVSEAPFFDVPKQAAASAEGGRIFKGSGERAAAEDAVVSEDAHKRHELPTRAPSPPRSVGEVVGAVGAMPLQIAEAGWSVAEAFYSIATGAAERSALDPEEAGMQAASAMACVEGVLRVDGDLAVDTASLRETLRAVLHSLLEPLAQVRGIALTLPSDNYPGIFATIGRGRRGGCSFAYRIYLVDPHDVEPLRETLLLEAETGGARSLLPLLMDRLCEEGRAMPRHLKVRLEVQSGQ